MAKAATSMDASSSRSRAALDEMLAEIDDVDARTLESRIQASEFAQRCLHEEEELEREKEREEKLSTIEQRVVEGVQLAVMSPAAGALSTWEPGGVAVGPAVNLAVGLLSKVSCFVIPENRTLRAASRAGKVLLHSQVSILTRNKIMEP